MTLVLLFNQIPFFGSARVTFQPLGVQANSVTTDYMGNVTIQTSSTVQVSGNWAGPGNVTITDGPASSVVLSP